MSRREPKRAVGLAYERDGDSAPRIVAKGRGEVAERILEVARAAGIPVREDPDLLELLAASDVGEEIPTEVYAAVARLLALLYRLNNEITTDSGPGAESD